MTPRPRTLSFGDDHRTIGGAIATTNIGNLESARQSATLADRKTRVAVMVPTTAPSTA